MSYFDDASLVMIPSGYKTSKVYSVKPTDGTGDLTFTRSNDTATRVGPDGLIEKVRTNEVRNSTMVGASAPSTLPTNWTLVSAGLTFTVIGTGTEGGLTYIEINATGTASSSNARIGFDSSTQILGATGQYWTNSFYLKKVSETAAPDGYTMAIFENTSAGSLVVANVGSLPATTSLARYSYTVLTAGGATVARVQPFVRFSLTSGNSYNFTFRVAAPQMEQGDIATQFIPTSTAAVSVGPVANVPRLDYLNSSCPRLLLEPQRTNLAIYSEQFDNSGWFKVNSTVTANAAVSPDGYTNADQFNFNASSDSSCYRSLSGSSAAYSTSIFAKYVSGGKYLYIFSPTNSESAKVWFDIEAGTVANQQSGFTGAIQDYGNGWYRCTLTNTSNKSLDYMQFGISSTSSSRTLSASSVTYFYGAQVEAGAYATSYIPTLGAAVTRGADACSKTGISSLIGQTAGTVFVDFEFSGSKDSFWPIITVMGAGAGELIEIYGSAGNNNMGVVMVDNGVTQFSQTITLTVGRHKLAIAYELNNTVAYLDGTVIGGVDTSCTIPTMTEIAIGKFSYSSAFAYGDRINQALLFKTRLSNADLAALTTI